MIPTPPLNLIEHWVSAANAGQRRPNQADIQLARWAAEWAYGQAALDRKQAAP